VAKSYDVGMLPEQAVYDLPFDADPFAVHNADREDVLFEADPYVLFDRLLGVFWRKHVQVKGAVYGVLSWFVFSVHSRNFARLVQPLCRLTTGVSSPFPRSNGKHQWVRWRPSGRVPVAVFFVPILVDGVVAFVKLIYELNRQPCFY